MSKPSLIENLTRIADALVLFFGRNCEVVVHDLHRLGNSVVHVAGTVTGRKVGAPSTNLLLKLLTEHGDAVKDLHTYSTQSPKGHPLKSSTMFMRDSEGRVVAALCINYDVTSHLNALALIEEHVRIESGQTTEAPVHETFTAGSPENGEELVRAVLKEFGKHPIGLDREERIDLVKMFNENGIFRIKGMVQNVATLMGVSKYTLYSYIRLCDPKVNTEL